MERAAAVRSRQAADLQWRKDRAAKLAAERVAREQALQTLPDNDKDLPGHAEHNWQQQQQGQYRIQQCREQQVGQQQQREIQW